MAFDFTKPNSTPSGAVPLVLTGVESASQSGSLAPQMSLFQAPEITALLSGVESDTAVADILALPNIIFLTGVQATGHLSDDAVGGPNPGTGTPITLTGIRIMSGTGHFGGVAPAGTPSTRPASALDIVAILKSLQVPAGPCAGSYFNNGAKGAINWYNANVGLVSIIQFLNATDLDLYVRPYLDAYVARLNGDLSISDVVYNAGSVDLFNIGLVPSADDDAYVSTFVRLAYRYTTASQNFAWFDTNKGILQTMLDNMLANNLRSDGLVATNRSSAVRATLKNNCEDWAALNEYSSLLNIRNDTFNAARYANLASGIASSIDSQLWVASGPYSPGFKASDTDQVLDTDFNPNVVAQAYPQTMGVTGLSGRYALAYAYINNNASGWENCGYDPNPWMVLGLLAALRGDSSRALTQANRLEVLYASSPAAITINELGMYQRIKSVLAGLPAA